MAGHRVERPREPHAVRGVRVPEAVRLLHREGDAPDARGAPRRQVGGVARHAGEGGDRRRPAPRPRPVGDDGTRPRVVMVKTKADGVVLTFEAEEVGYLRAEISRTTGELEGGVPEHGVDPV